MWRDGLCELEDRAAAPNNCATPMLDFVRSLLGCPKDRKHEHIPDAWDADGSVYRKIVNESKKPFVLRVLPFLCEGY
ncbi:MAG: hypothetical protein ACRD9L_03785 [Bryobacteraceae bacterium]